MGRTRTVYLETREDRDAVRLADEAEFGPRFAPHNDDEDDEIKGPVPSAEAEPEYASIEEFVTFLFDDDRKAFGLDDVQKLQYILRRSPGPIIAELKSYGLTYNGPTHTRTVRGFTANSHNLYAGNPMGGGSGFTHDGPGKVRRG